MGTSDNFGKGCFNCNIVQMSEGILLSFEVAPADGGRGDPTHGDLLGGFLVINIASLGCKCSL